MTNVDLRAADNRSSKLSQELKQAELRRGGGPNTPKMARTINMVLAQGGDGAGEGKGKGREKPVEDQPNTELESDEEVFVIGEDYD